jgi:hypothetical protein
MSITDVLPSEFTDVDWNHILTDMENEIEQDEHHIRQRKLVVKEIRRLRSTNAVLKIAIELINEEIPNPKKREEIDDLLRRILSDYDIDPVQDARDEDWDRDA